MKFSKFSWFISLLLLIGSNAFAMKEGDRVESIGVESKSPLGTVTAIVDGLDGQKLISVKLDGTETVVKKPIDQFKVLNWDELNHKKAIDENRDYLTLQEAIELMSEFKKSAELAFNYPLDGCYWRAHVMAVELKKKVPTEKVWINEPLVASDAPPDAHQSGWAFHVAPVVWVEEKSGEKIRKVLDPSLSDLPMSFEDWAGKMSAGSSTHRFVPKLEGNGKKHEISLFPANHVFPSGNGDVSDEQALEIAKKDLQRISKLK